MFFLGNYILDDANGLMLHPGGVRSSVELWIPQDLPHPGGVRRPLGYTP